MIKRRKYPDDDVILDEDKFTPSPMRELNINDMKIFAKNSFGVDQNKTSEEQRKAGTPLGASKLSHSQSSHLADEQDDRADK